MLNSLEDPVDIFEVFPYEAVDTRIFGESFKQVRAYFIACGRSFDWNIINKWNNNVRDFVLQ